jgi:hypothetical protein
LLRKWLKPLPCRWSSDSWKEWQGQGQEGLLVGICPCISCLVCFLHVWNDPLLFPFGKSSCRSNQSSVPVRTNLRRQLLWGEANELVDLQEDPCGGWRTHHTLTQNKKHIASNESYDGMQNDWSSVESVDDISGTREEWVWAR